MIEASRIKVLQLDSISWEDLKYALSVSEGKNETCTRWYYEGTNHEFEAVELRDLINRVEAALGDRKIEQ